jgi:VIT1/CCC1 family predicted Fe2+/Mn2+ transporter
MTSMTNHADVSRYLANWQAEVDSAAQYRAMAAGSSAPEARVYESLAVIEEKHASFWEERLRSVGRTPGPRRPSWRARTLMWSARRWGAASILPTVASHELVSRNDYVPQRETSKTGMTGEERMHARVLETMLSKTSGVQGSTIGKIEGRHHSLAGNTLRAAVLGANDGLCSNLALVMGVAGASVNEHTVLLTGIAGLLAGAASMGLGEWVSVTSSRELAARELRIERGELEASPEQEREELQLIYEAKGLTPEEAKDLSSKLLADPKNALEVLAREELGIDPADLGGSPWAAAGTSMLLFALGAVIPVVPFMFLKGTPAIVASIAAGGAALFLIGTIISIFTGRSAAFSGGRQLVLGLLAAGVTFAVGRLIGVAIGG